MKLSLPAFLLTLACVTGAVSTVKAQHVYQIRADSVRIYNVCDTAELIIENRTRGVSGYLVNKGGGRTEFRKIDLVQVGGSKLAIAGQDTIDLAQLSGVGGVDTIYRSGDSIRYVKKGIIKGVYAPLPPSAEQFVLNRTVPAQIANFNITGYGRITQNGSSSYATGFMLVPATGTGGVNLQLTGDAIPGMAIWTHDGTKQRLHSAFHANGTFSKYGDSGIVAISQLGNEMTFSRDGANYIRAVGTNGYFDFVTGGRITSDLTSSFTIYPDKTAVFKGNVRMDSLPAKVLAASRFLAIDNGVVSTRTGDQVLSDISGIGRTPRTVNPTYLDAYTGNLDSITNSGIFHIGVAANSPSVQPGYLFSGGNNGGASTYKVQLFGAYNTENELFFRQGIAGGNWGPWHKIASENWVKNRLTADSLKVIRNGTTAQTADFNITGSGTVGTVITQLMLSNVSNQALTLIGGSTAASGNRGGQIVMFGGTHASNAGQITFHTGQGGGGTLQPEAMRILQDGKVGIGTAAPATLLHVNGNVTATAYYQSSLRSLKKDIQPFAGSALQILGSAKVRSFIFKADTTGHRSIGFIADEVPAEIATPGNNGVDQANVVGLLVKAIQELKAEKDAMEAQLKAKNDALEARLNAIEILLKSK